mgnify:CR=1 FL=1
MRISINDFWRRFVARIRSTFPYRRHSSPETVRIIAALDGANEVLEAELQQLRGKLEAARSEDSRRLSALEQLGRETERAASRTQNRLAGQEAAIVTDIPGTTRDILREHIQIDGLPIHIIDTAGLRDSEDVVEQEGIRRAREAIGKADRILYMMIDESDLPDENSLPAGIPLTLIRNKIDLTGEPAAIAETEQGTGVYTRIYLSVKTGEGIELLKQHLKNSMGYQQSTEGQFIARRRHLDAINAAAEYLGEAQKHLNVNQAGELLAEECRLAQQELSSITGEFSSDDLLGRIFSDFCIGK